jgi:hypothetical protein
LKIKLKSSHFDTTEIIKEESQAVLNTFTEHDFQDAIRNGRSAGNGTSLRKGITSKMMWPTAPKLVFD